MKYIKKFDTHAEYEAAQSGLILPNVSFCVDTPNEVHYNPYVEPTTTYEAIDLGLPSGTLWANMNVGATSETDYGNYYEYGKGADDYTVTSGQSDYYSGTENPLAASADTAAIVMGGQWHMPTQAQFNELTANTDYTWTTIDGVNGGKFASKTDNTKFVFFPAAGSWKNSSNSSNGNEGRNGRYWSSTPFGGGLAYYLYFNSGSKYVDNFQRMYCFTVRGVIG